MTWRRYGLILLLVAATCLVLGVVVAACVYVATNGGYGSGARGLLGMVLLGAYVGGASGLGASTGALAALASINNTRYRQSVRSALGMGVFGAVVGAAVPWTVTALGNIWKGQSDWANTVVPVATAGITAAALAVGIAVAIVATRTRREP
jgi:hypothetical protein